MTDINQWTTPQTWTITLEEDPETGDLILPFPPEFLAQANWNIGDTLNWEEQSDGSFVLSKKEAEDNTVNGPANAA